MHILKYQFKHNISFLCLNCQKDENESHENPFRSSPEVSSLRHKEWMDIDGLVDYRMEGITDRIILISFVRRQESSSRNYHTRVH
jgi:hypothetical protein